MNAANLLTVGRLILAPFFVLAYALVDIWPTAIPASTVLPIMWALFLVMELTDVLDGLVARKQGLVTDIGKVLDPFADVVCRLTYFVTLTVAGIIPLWFVFVVIYRELGAVFLRLLFIKDGFALGAGKAGKLKSWFYSLSAAIALFLFTSDRLQLQPGTPVVMRVVRIAATGLYVIAGVLAVWSIVGYLLLYIRRKSQAD